VITTSTERINLHRDYFDHPKTRRLVGLLGQGAAEWPIRLWCFVAKVHAETGILQGYSAEEIESVIQWQGDRGRCVSAMVKVGYLEPIEGGYRVHDWLDFNSHISDARLQSQIMHAAKRRKRETTPHSETDRAPDKGADSSADSDTDSDADSAALPSSPPAYQPSSSSQRSDDEDIAFDAWMKAFGNPSPADRADSQSIKALAAIIKTESIEVVNAAVKAFKTSCNDGKIKICTLSTFIKCAGNYLPAARGTVRKVGEKPDPVDYAVNVLETRMKNEPMDSMRWKGSEGDKKHLLLCYNTAKSADRLPAGFPPPPDDQTPQPRSGVATKTQVQGGPSEPATKPARRVSL